MNPIIRLNAAPPVAERPRCPACTKPRKPLWETVKNERITRANGFDYQLTVEWRGHYRGYGAFCTLRCCEAYANAAYQLKSRK